MRTLSSLDMWGVPGKLVEESRGYVEARTWTPVRNQASVKQGGGEVSEVDYSRYAEKARSVEAREPDPKSPLVRAPGKSTIIESLDAPVYLRTWDQFVSEARQLLEPTAAGKGYNDTGVDGKNELFEFVQNVAQGSGHALGEIIYKAVRYSRKKDPSDLLKVAAWAYLAWKFEK